MKRYILLALLGIGLAAAALHDSRLPSAFQAIKAPAPQPTISWSTSRIQIEMAPGAFRVRYPTFSVSQVAEALTIEAVPELSRFITIQPPTLQRVDSNQPHEVRLGFQIPTGMQAGSYEGTVHVRSGARTLAQPLKLTLIVVPQLTAKAALVTIAEELEAGDIEAALQSFSQSQLNREVLSRLSPEQRTRFAAALRGARPLRQQGSASVFEVAGAIDGVPPREMSLAKMPEGNWVVISW